MSLVLGAITASPLMAETPRVVIEPDGTVTRLLYQGENLVKPLVGNERHVQARIRTADGGTENVRGRPTAEHDVQRGRSVYKHEALTVGLQFGTSEHRVDIDVVVAVTGSQDLESLTVDLLHLYLPQWPGVAGAIDQRMGWFGLRSYAIENFMISLANWNIDPRAVLRIDGPKADPDDTRWHYAVQMVLPPARTYSHPIISDDLIPSDPAPLAAGEQHRYRFSLFFTDDETSVDERFPEFGEHFRSHHPQRVDWPDRRPIGAIWMANPITGWETNPRGWISNLREQEDVTTEEGLVKFGEGLMAYADRCIETLAKYDAQGMIFWDLEGAEMFHPVTYMGTPEMLGEVAPEMERFADDFFKKFTDAGLRVGITLRPTSVYMSDRQHPRWKGWRQRWAEEPIEELSQKITYARERWGCTIFYLDSNVFDSQWMTDEQKKQMEVPQWVLPYQWMDELMQRHPDVLIIPEWGEGVNYAYGAPYKSSNLSQIRSPSDIKTIYPEAFSLTAPSNHLMLERWDEYLTGQRMGDVLLLHAWFDHRSNQLYSHLDKEAQWLDAGPPADVLEASADGIANLLDHEDARTRYSALLRVAELGMDNESSLLASRLDDEEFIIQRRALALLADSERTVGSDVLDKVLPHMTGRDWRLQHVAARAVGQVGEKAVEVLLALPEVERPLAAQTNLRQALALTRTANDRAFELVAAPLRAEDAPLSLRRQTASIVGLLTHPDVKDVLLECLKDDDMAIRRAAIEGFRGKGDRSVVPALIEAWQKPSPPATATHLNLALRELTGQNLLGRLAWEKWWSEQ